jgi:hypothetical protein
MNFISIICALEPEVSVYWHANISQTVCKIKKSYYLKFF